MLATAGELKLPTPRPSSGCLVQAGSYEPVLTKTRWLLLKQKSNLNAKQRVSLREFVQ